MAFVVCEPEDKFFSDPFFATVLKGAHRVVAESLLQLVFVVVATDEDRARLERYASGGHLDGAMFVSLHGNEPMPARLHALGVPVVLAGRSLDPTATLLPFVDVDNAGGAASATQRRTPFRSPAPDLSTSAEAWLLAGGPHHTVLSSAVDLETLYDFARIAGEELLVIDEGTTMRDFANELRWNAAYHRLEQRL